MPRRGVRVSRTESRELVTLLKKATKWTKAEEERIRKNIGILRSCAQSITITNRN